MAYDYKQDFPLLRAMDVAYVDNAATAQRPQCVLDAENDFYCRHNANPLRGLYPLSVEATDAYEAAREAVRDFLAEHISENFTQEELSARFDFALTPMKTCFKAAYGTSIGAWLTDYRMNYAAEILLREKRRNIAEIAAQVGYDSASKFAAAFKRVKHMTPAEYRSALR